LTRKELNLAIFERKANAVLWQPRLETWISHHQKHGTMPERYRGMDTLEIYDALRCSVRYAVFGGIETYNEPDDVIIEERHEGDRKIISTTTPSGTITAVHREIWEDGELVNSRIEKYPVSTGEDLKVVIDIIERQQFRTNVDAFIKDAERLGHRGEPNYFLTSSGFTDMIKCWAGLENTFYILADSRDIVEAYLEACDRRDKRQIDAALKLPCRIFNLGDHATNEFTPPPILEKYMLPRWQWISDLMHSEGRFVHSHWDGNCRQILPYLKASGLDSIEALTPKPQGDVTLEEIKAAVGDEIVCLDLIPAIHFLEHYSTEEVLEFTRKIIDMFAPRLVLGISDEISQVGQIEKVEAITELVDSICGLAD